MTRLHACIHTYPCIASTRAVVDVAVGTLCQSPPCAGRNREPVCWIVVGFDRLGCKRSSSASGALIFESTADSKTSGPLCAVFFVSHRCDPSGSFRGGRQRAGGLLCMLCYCSVLIPSQEGARRRRRDYCEYEALSDRVELVAVVVALRTTYSDRPSSPPHRRPPDHSTTSQFAPHPHSSS